MGDVTGAQTTSNWSFWNLARSLGQQETHRDQDGLDLPLSALHRMGFLAGQSSCLKQQRTIWSCESLGKMSFLPLLLQPHTGITKGALAVLGCSHENGTNDIKAHISLKYK